MHLRSGHFQAGVHSFSLTTETGPCGSEANGTKAIFHLQDAIDYSRWSVAASCHSGNEVELSICSPPDAPIGKYSLTMTQDYRTINVGEFVLLFNPWCPADAVYMPETEKLNEYILAQDGIIFRGNHKYPVSDAWNFGQFAPRILDICLRILDTNPKFLRKPEMDCSGRRNPVYVTRVVSAMINCNDDKGVLFGRWQDDYADGVSPSSWTGSVDILHCWDSKSCQPVRYGQCWVFAAVACTVLRALGIPTRVVTNFLSAHDTNANLVIERYYDENGQSQKNSGDMIWNYHCWVESWMNRPDLKAGFEGWQASDPTPQEKSEGVYCCGPVPLKAIKEGELKLKYDVPFVFAEVNADVVTYIKRKDGTQDKVKDHSQVGVKISTKSVGSDKREDITHLYKYPEGSKEERQVFMKANHQNKLLDEPQEPGLDLKIKVSPNMKKGCDFDVFAAITNNTDKPKLCRLLFSSRGAYYNGTTFGAECGKKDLLNLQLSPDEEKRVPLRLNYSKYGSAITKDNLIKLVALLIEYQTNDTKLVVRDIVLEDPEIKIKILGEPKQNRKLAAEITLQNPLSEPLDNCSFCVEGADLTGGRTIKKTIKSVGPGQEAKMKVDLTPTQGGVRKLVVDFNSTKLHDVKGYRNVIISK
ncbi:TGM2 glutamyltransferase, partial [Amia calva]|nr:TGM2 glutamyltransferase [Amia calva]